MIDGYTMGRDLLEDIAAPDTSADREMARALAADGCTVSELAYLLDTNPMRAWWLSDYKATNDSGDPADVIASRIRVLAGSVAA